MQYTIVLIKGAYIHANIRGSVDFNRQIRDVMCDSLYFVTYTDPRRNNDLVHKKIMFEWTNQI